MVRETTGLEAVAGPDFSLTIPRPGREPTDMHLQNIYAETSRLEGRARRDMLVRAVRGILGSPSRPEAWEAAATMLRPAVRAVSWVAAGGSARVLCQPLVPFVQAMIAIDFPDTMTFATVDDLKVWGVDEAEVQRTAVANLKTHFVALAQAGPVGTMLGPDGYISSWLAAPEPLSEITAGLFGPEPVAIAIGRDYLQIVDTTDPDVVCAQLREALDAYPNVPRQLSPVPYLIRAQGIEPWQPPAGHPAAHLVHHTQSLLAQVEYEQQKNVLQGVLEEAGEDVFVGGYQLMQRTDGTVWSWSAWPHRVTNGLIPHTDYIVIEDSDDDSSHIIVAWDDVIRIAGASLRAETGHDPPRWRYHGPPDETAMTTLRNQAVDPTAS